MLGEMNEEVERLHPGLPGYGATSETEDESHDRFYESDESIDDDHWNDDETELPPSLLRRIWDGIKNMVLVVLHVDNLWDAPDQPPASRAQFSRELQRRNHLVVLFWFFILALSYAGERSTFKLLVDRAGPFRLFSVEIVTASHAILLGLVMFVAYLMGQSPQLQSLGVSLIDVCFMALLDTISLLLVYLTGLRVPPTLTVILVQFTLPLTAFLTQFVHPDGLCVVSRGQQDEIEEEDGADERRGLDNSEHRGLLSSMGQGDSSPSSIFDEAARHDDTSHRDNLNNPQHPPEDESPLPGFGGLSRGHVWGSLIIFLAVLIALCPAFYAMINPIFFLYADPIPMRTAINTLLYVSSCIPAAACTLYKEHIFLKYKQPVRMDYLNLLLSVFQFIIASILSPLLFGLQGIGAAGSWEKLYPSTAFSENYKDGLKCFFWGLSSDDQENKYPEEAHCRYAMPLVLIHVLSIIFIGVAVDKIVNAGATKVMYRGISGGIIVSVIAMHVYDMHEPAFNYGDVVDGLNLISLIILVFGSEVYHRVTLQDSTFETEFQTVGDIYEGG